MFKEAIKNSLIYKLITKIIFLCNQSLFFSFTKVNHRRFRYSSFIERSFAVRALKKIDAKIDILNAKIYTYYEKSFLYSFINAFNRIFHASYIYKLFLKWTKTDYFGFIFLFVPVLYIFVDFIIRKITMLSSFASYWDEFYLLFLFVYLILRRINSKGRISYNFSPMGFIIAIYFMLGLIHLFCVQPNTKIAVEGFRAVYQQALWYFVFAQFLRNSKEVKAVMRLISFMGIFLSLHAIYQFVRKVPMPGNWIDTTETIKVRAFSIVGSPNILGVIFVLFIPVAIALFFVEKDFKLKIIHGASSILMTGGLLLTFSRGAWLAFALSSLTLVILLNKKLIAVLTLVFSAFIISGNRLSQRLLFMLRPQYLMKSAAGGRIYRWEIGLKVWEKSKFWGVGLGRFGGAVAINNDLAPFYLDNYYLKTLVETGYFGITSLFFMIFSFIIFGLKTVFMQMKKEKRIMAASLFAGAIGILSQNFVENIFEVPAMFIYFYLFVAMINALRQEGLKDDENESAALN